MRKFLLTIWIFLLVFSGITVASLLFIPNKKIIGNSLYSTIDKHKRLDSLPSPKIIFAGGSNLAFGLDSKTVEEKTGMPVVNMGLHAGFGMYFPVNEVKHAIKQGDVVIFSPVYSWFTNSNDMIYGEKVLVAHLFDVDRKNLKYIDGRQAVHLIPNTVSYAISKLFPKQLDIMQGHNYGYEVVYKRNSFNEYGDESMHWYWENQTIATPADTAQTNSKVSKKAISIIADFKNFTEKQGAAFYLIPPAFQKSNSLNNRDLIKNIENRLVEKNIHFSITPENANIADSLFFNTAYHPNKQGVNIYTKMILDSIFNKKNE